MSIVAKSSDNKSNPEGVETYKQYILVLEKKIRNLEKRKSKLDDYKVKQNSGQELNEDQKLAVSHYSEVLVLLETLNDLHKTYVSINNDIVKNLKKQAKKVKTEKDQEQSNNIIEVLKLYYLFSALQVPKVKDDLLNHKNASYSTSENEYSLLSDILHSIFNFPTSVPKVKLLETLGKASDHAIGLISNKDKPFLNTESSYKLIKSLVDKLVSSGYFDSTNVSLPKSNDNSISTKTINNEKKVMPSSIDSDIDSSSEDNDGMVHVEKPDGKYPLNSNKEHHEDQNANRMNKPNQNPDDVSTHVNKNGNYPNSREFNKNHLNGAINNKADTRTLNDLLSSFQSGFTFMQDSVIESDRQPYYS